MKKLIILLTLAISAFIFSQRAVSQIQLGPSLSFKKDTKFYVAPFRNYFPLNGEGTCNPGPLFNDLIQDLANLTAASPKTYCFRNYEETIRIGAKGAVDIALGIYSDTSLYEEWKIIYPAVIDNPVHLVMVPSRISEVKSIDDLKNLKGAIDSRDHFNDFVTDQLQNFNLEKLDNSEEIYRKLISGEIDYVFVTYWYGMAEVLKLGVQEMVSFSKKSIWNMPLFLGVSKMSQNRRFFSHQLTEWMKDDAKREKFKQRIIEALQQLAEENRGKVPLTYQPNKSDM